MKKLLLIIMVILGLMASACGVANDTPVRNKAEEEAVVANGETEEAPVDNTYIRKDGIEVIYLAGGCFWGTEKLMQTIKGVVEATSGYANGMDDVEANYQNVSSTGYKETVRVEYEPAKVSLDTILFAYFRSIDPAITNRQGNDIGSQYQAGVYWADDTAKETVLRIASVERKRFDDFAVEIEPLRIFHDAEEYHQNYLDKNPDGYCHVSLHEFELVSNIIVDPAKYLRPSDEAIKAALTGIQFAVTQEAATEPPFNNEYWDNHEKGIYVDIVTGEPLFSSVDKFDSGTGWPSFTKAIDENALVSLNDESLQTGRTEIRSRAGNSHLGHVFYGENESPNGVRFCINSASLRFIPYDQMAKEGYDYLEKYVNERY